MRRVIGRTPGNLARRIVTSIAKAGAFEVEVLNAGERDLRSAEMERVRSEGGVAGLQRAERVLAAAAIHGRASVETGEIEKIRRRPAGEGGRVDAFQRNVAV